MRLGLSSAIAPDASFDELLVLCARQGVGALELREEDAHGVDRDRAFEAAGFATAADVAGVAITGFRAVAEGSELRLARLSEALGTTVLIDTAPDMRHAIERAGALRSVGARVGIVLTGAESDDDIALLALSTFEIAWDADPIIGSLQQHVDRILTVFGTRLRHVRVSGGPELTTRDDSGLTPVIERLERARFDGVVSFVPAVVPQGTVRTL